MCEPNSQLRPDMYVYSCINDSLTRCLGPSLRNESQRDFICVLQMTGPELGKLLNCSPVSAKRRRSMSTKKFRILKECDSTKRYPSLLLFRPYGLRWVSMSTIVFMYTCSQISTQWHARGATKLHGGASYITLKLTKILVMTATIVSIDAVILCSIESERYWHNIVSKVLYLY